MRKGRERKMPRSKKGKERWRFRDRGVRMKRRKGIEMKLSRSRKGRERKLQRNKKVK